MIEEIVSVNISDKDFNELYKKYEDLGYRIAAISNAGLPKNKKRITFLHKSAFKDDPK